MKTKKIKSKFDKYSEIKYGDEVRITKGFFRGLQGKAIDFQDNNPEIYTKFGIQIEPIENKYQVKLPEGKHWFDRSQLEKVEVQAVPNSMLG